MTSRTQGTGNAHPPRLSISMDGPRVGKARLSASDLVEIVRCAQQALKRVGQVLYGESSVGKGRKRRDIEELCELFLVNWESGSAVAELELGKPPAQLQLFGYVGEESLQAFVSGMTKIAESILEPSQLPIGFDVGVLQTCDRLGRVLDHGIETIRFDAKNGRATSPASFDPPLRDKVRELLGRRVEVSGTAKTGRLEELNGHAGLTGRLWEADGTKWYCQFKREHLDQLADAWMRTVRLVGQASVGEDRERILHVEALVLLGDEIADVSESSAVPFWRSLSLDELAKEQGVLPVTDIDEISDLWPEDDDPDGLLAHVLAERATRRRLNDGGEKP